MTNQEKNEENLPLRFDFSFYKFQATLVYLASKVPALDKLRVGKLIYLIDKASLLKYGKPIIGGVYYNLSPCGPVPSLVLDYINRILAIERKYWARLNPLMVDSLQKNLRINRSFENPRLEPSGEIDVSDLSESELAIIEEVISESEQYETPALIDMIHKHATCTDTGKNEIIDYKLFFKDGAGPGLRGFKSALATQRDRDLIHYLNR